MSVRVYDAKLSEGKRKKRSKTGRQSWKSDISGKGQVARAGPTPGRKLYSSGRDKEFPHTIKLRKSETREVSHTRYSFPISSVDSTLRSGSEMTGGGYEQGPYGSHQGGYHQGYQGAQGMPQGSYPMATTNNPYPENTENLVTIYCENNPNYRLAMRTDGIVLAFKNPEDPNQQWVKIDVSERFKDQEGNPGFILVNKATGHAMCHGDEVGEAVTPQTYRHGSLDQALLWSQGKDEGKGYTAIRPVTNVHLNLDADHGDKKHGGVEDGNRLLVHKWNKQDNQKWKIVPVGIDE